MINGKKKIIRTNIRRTPLEKANDALIGITAAVILGVVVLLLTAYFSKNC